jgi:hypothetical protein
VDERASVHLVEHGRILRRRQGGRMERLEASWLSDALRQRCVMAAIAYRLDTGHEPYRLVVEASGEVTVTAAREYFRHCQLNGYLCKTGLSGGTLSSFRDHFTTPSGLSAIHQWTTYPQSGRAFIAHQLS